MIPQYKISAGAITAESDSLSKSGLPVALRVDLRLNQVNTAWIRLGPVPDDSVEIGDEVTIELGDSENGTETVFTGLVTELRSEAGSFTIGCASAMMALTRHRVNKFYEQQKAGDIVGDMADMAEVSTGKVESGLNYPYYALGADRNLFAHMLILARRDGFDTYADPDDGLVFAAYSGSDTLSLRYGAEILAFQSGEEPLQTDGVEIYGESPASLGQGDKAYSWLTKEEVKGKAGASSGNILRLADPSLRNEDAAGVMAEKVLSSLSAKKSGWVEVIGAPKAILGGAVSLEDMPGGGPDGEFKILSVRHQLDKRKGFVTTIHWKEE